MVNCRVDASHGESPGRGPHLPRFVRLFRIDFQVLASRSVVVEENIGRLPPITQRFKNAVRALPRAVLIAAMTWFLLFLILFVVLSNLSGSAPRFVFGGSDQATS